MKNTSENNNMIYIILIVFISFVFIIISEVFLINNIANRKTDVESTFKYKTNDKYFDTSNLNTIDIDIQDKYTIGDTCTDECYYKYQNYYFLYKKVNNNYQLTIVDGNRLLKEVVIGDSIEESSISKYQDNILVYNIKTNSSFRNDYLIIINDKNQIDEYTSLEANEIDYNEDGVIYYYSRCNKDNQENNAYRIKAIREPFTANTKELSKEEKSYSWCAN